MASLNFPNASRCYNARRQQICFWGYDSALEISFFLDVGTLRKLTAKTPHDEAGYLDAFDAARPHIYETARKAYARGRKDAYVLCADDF
ncbi:MAG TPA: DUF1488 family protein [Kiloniellaceae bacterium]|nr:DUF1488 family protein [Kiloniellaceae bacterium]